MIEPDETDSVVTSVATSAASSILVELRGGRMQTIQLHNLTGDATTLGVTIIQTQPHAADQVEETDHE